MKGSFKINWLVGQFTNPKLIKKQFRILKNPLTFYVGSVLKLFPFYKDKINTLKFKDGYKIRIYDFMSFYIYSEIFIDECYDVDLNVEEPIIFDVGANTGFFALRMKQLYPKATIYCFEPYPPCIDHLRETIYINELKNVEVKTLAISDKAGKSKLYIHPTNIGGHSIFSENVSENYVDIESINLNEALDYTHPKLKCNLLKLDCEGAEFPIIKSLHLNLSNKFKCLIYEPTYDSYDIDELNEYLKKLGYEVSLKQSLYLACKK